MIAVARQSRLLRRPYRRFVLTKVGECLYRSEAGSYFAVVKVNGKQYRHCLGTPDRDIARRKLNEYRQQLRGSVPANGKIPAAITFGQVVEMWLESISVHVTKRTYERRLGCVNHPLRSFKAKPIGAITLLDCERWATKRSRAVRARTFNYDLETLRLIFAYGIQHGIVMDNPAAGLRRRRSDTAAVVIPSRQQFVRLIQDMRQRTTESADIVEFLAYSGFIAERRLSSSTAKL